MSTRPLLTPFSVITNASMATSLTSSPTIINYVSGVSYDVTWTGAPVGNFTVEVSNTYSEFVDGTVKNAGSWTTLTLTGTVSPAGTSGNGMINVAGIEVYAIRLVYTRTSGTGTLNAVVCGKVQ